MYPTDKDGGYCLISLNYNTDMCNHVLSSRRISYVFVTDDDLNILRGKVCKLVHNLVTEMNDPLKAGSLCPKAGKSLGE